MRIAQIAPLWERVPPPGYGGVELVVGLLSDELVRRGHEVTLFASGDSMTLAQLAAVCPRALRLDPEVNLFQVYEALQLSQVFQQAHQFDIIHSHIGFPALLGGGLVKTPTVHTLHGALTPQFEKPFAAAAKQPFVSISNSQRQPMPQLNYRATVYNGIDVSMHRFHSQPQDPPYLAFLGRLSPEKGVHHAIAIAKQGGWTLKMAGKVDRVDVEYFEQEVKPHIDGEQIQFLGEANHIQKNALMGGAVATLFPITWQEPFGLVMIESMAAGTPVIAMPLGSTPEVIAHGKTGFLCKTVAECVAALQQVRSIDRRTCRQHVVQHFSVQSMVDGYEQVYRGLMGDRFRQDGRVRQLVKPLS